MIRRRRALVSCLASCLALALCGAACRREPAATAAKPEAPAECAARKTEFDAFLGRLPERAVAGSIRVELPTSSIGASPGAGPVFQISEQAIDLDGERVAGRDGPARVERFKTWLASWAERPNAGRALYVAAAADVDVRTLRSYLVHVPEALELRLLVRTDADAREPGARPEALDLAQRILSEENAVERAALANQGYAAFASCAAFESAAASIGPLEARERWPALRAALIAAAPSCRCEELDTQSLRQVIVAEQRAGAAALGSLPFSFIRDERCGASMPLRGIGKLVGQIQRFDEEFAGAYQADALRFEQVVGNERLLGYFCNALPGETLSAQQRARATLYLRVAGSETCQAWRFEPLAPGAPMGTWRRVSGTPLAFHYWQGAEEIRLFGPVATDPPSAPTDRREWACEQNYRMAAVDSQSIALEAGGWFFSEDSCRKANPDAALPPGCVATLAGGTPPNDAPSGTR